MTGPEEAGGTRRKSRRPVPPLDEATEIAIAAYIDAHPDFVERHPGVLQALMPPAVDAAGGVVDFQRYMVARLKADIDRLGVERSTLIHTVQANARSQSRIHDAILALIEARSLGEMIEVLTGDLAVMLDVDVVAMAVESGGLTHPGMETAGIRVIAPGSIDKWLGRYNVKLHGDTQGDAELYGPAAGLVRSEALLRLTVSQQTPVGLLAFGSRDPMLFQDGQGTELIGFFGGIVERLIRRWLDLPS